MNRTRPAHGFTLVEILVVLCIVGILAALLFTVFTRVRANGLSTTCQSNLKQISLAMQQYVQDNDGRYPNTDYFAIKLDPYLKNYQVYQCPSDPTPQGTNPKASEFNDYTIPSFFVDIINRVPTGKHEVVVIKPTTTILLFDFNLLDPSLSANYEGSCGPSSYWPINHSGGGNYGFVDGHVKWFRPSQAYDSWCSNQAKN